MFSAEKTKAGSEDIHYVTCGQIFTVVEENKEFQYLLF